MASLYAKETNLPAELIKKHPQVKLAVSENEILKDKSIPLILSSIIAEQIAGVGILAMQHGEDYLSGKTGITSLKQLKEQ